MKRTIKFTYYLAAWIAGLFIFSMFATYFSEYLQSSGFFGDTPHKGDPTSIFANDGPDRLHDWGARHYWYFWLCIALWLLTVVRIVVWAAWYFDEQNPANKVHK